MLTPDSKFFLPKISVPLKINSDSQNRADNFNTPNQVSTNVGWVFVFLIIVKFGYLKIKNSKNHVKE
jgi:hypothetical protein